MSGDINTTTLRLKKILTEELVLGLSIDQIGDDTSLIEGGLDIDSIGIMEVIALVETAFSIEFRDEDLRLRTFDSIGTLAKVIASRMDG